MREAYYAIGWMLCGEREGGTCQGQHVGEGHSAVSLELVRRSSEDDVIAAYRREEIAWNGSGAGVRR